MRRYGAAPTASTASTASTAPAARPGPTRSRRAVPLALAIVAAVVVALMAVLGFLGGAGAAAVTTSILPPVHAPKTFDVARPAPPKPAAGQPFRSCSIDDITAQAGALTFHGYAINSQTGEVLFDRRSDDPNPTASTLKLVVAAAALAVLGPDYRIPTRVYEGELAGEVVIAGGGDPTLSSLAPGIPSYYDGATAFLTDLASQTLTARGERAVTSVSFDTSRFGGEEWRTSWNEQDRLDGYVPPMTALMIDGGRVSPPALVSTRTDKPAEWAAASFATKLGLAPTAVLGSATVPAGAVPLAEVWSQPVSELIRYAVLDSDNAVSEALARLVAIEMGTGNTFDAINPAVVQAMQNLGLDTTGLLAFDGSGLSERNRVTAAMEVALLQRIGGDEFGLGRILDVLPASGLTGSLDTRFDPASSGVPGGAIRAKTGFIDDVYGLAGFIAAADGTKLTFAYYVVGKVQVPNRDVLDAIAAATYRCGGLLADW